MKIFWHELKFNLLRMIREKECIIWYIIFPVFLGLCFKLFVVPSFNNNFETIKTAVVQTEEDETFNEVIEEMKIDDVKFADVEFTDKENAEKMLADNEIEAVIYTDDLSIETAGSSTKITMLKIFIQQYKNNAEIIKNTAENNPQNIQEVIKILEDDAVYNKDLTYGNKNFNISVNYFYSLIAMVALTSMMNASCIYRYNSSEGSACGKRKKCSPADQRIIILAVLCSYFIFHIFLVSFCITYVHFILKINLGSKLILTYIAGVFAALLGVSIGFFTEYFINRKKQRNINALYYVISLGSCFFSGLMINTIPAMVNKYAPWFNYINPATIITRALFSLQAYEGYTQYLISIISMFLGTLILVTGGLILAGGNKNDRIKNISKNN